MISWNRPPDFVKSLYPLSQWTSFKGQQFIFSFDDGPGPVTQELLDLALEYNTKFIFFIIPDQLNKYPEIIERMINEGHIIGSHFFKHRSHFMYTKFKFLDSLKASVNKINEFVNIDIEFCRAPYGRIFPWHERWIEEFRMKHVFWSLDSKDYNFEKKDLIISRIMTNIKLKDIILFHDGMNHHPDLVSIIRECLINLKLKYD